MGFPTFVKCGIIAPRKRGEGARPRQPYPFTLTANPCTVRTDRIDFRAGSVTVFIKVGRHELRRGGDEGRPLPQHHPLSL